MEYYAFQDNVYVDEFPNFKRESQVIFFFMQATDGRFTIPALPGRGLITARAPEGAIFMVWVPTPSRASRTMGGVSDLPV